MTRHNPWLVHQDDRRARLGLFCFPYAGGGASAFTGWAARLPPEIAVYAVQLPGRQNRLREAAITSFPELIASLANALGDHLDLPFACFGHSMGALIALEWLRELRRRGAPPAVHLFVSACHPPHHRESQPAAELSDAELVERLRDFAGTPPEALQNQELMALLLPTLRADLALCRSYRFAPSEPLSCPITAYGGLDDRAVTMRELAQWQHAGRGRIRVRMFAGGHFFLHTARDALVADLTTSLPALGARDLRRAH